MIQHSFFDDMEHDEEKATAKLLKENRQYFLTYMNHNFQNIPSQDAESIYTDSIVEVWEQVKRGKLTRENLTVDIKTYIVAIGKVKAMHYLSERKMILPFTHVFTPDSGEYDTSVIDNLSATIPDYGNSIDRSRVRELLEKIDQKCRRLLELFAVAGASMEAIAIQLKLKNANAAKTQKYRCTSALKILYEKTFGEKLEEITL